MGPGTDPAAVSRIAEAAATRARTHVTVELHGRGGAAAGAPGLSDVQLSPLYDASGHVSHLLAVVTPAAARAAPSAAAAALAAQVRGAARAAAAWPQRARRAAAAEAAGESSGDEAVAVGGGRM